MFSTQDHTPAPMVLAYHSSDTESCMTCPDVLNTMNHYLKLYEYKPELFWKQNRLIRTENYATISQKYYSI